MVYLVKPITTSLFHVVYEYLRSSSLEASAYPHSP
jgi:hypothetical protein